jgi:hypothetical protein
MIREVNYFEKSGKENTKTCIEIVEKLVNEGLTHVVVATTSGETALEFGRTFQGRNVNLVAVTHNVGFAGPNKDDCTPEARKEMESLGMKVFTGTILTRSIEAALMKKHKGIYPAYIVAETLRLLGQGIKVVVEIAMEACDAGMIPEGEDIVAVGGTGRGADTVAIIRAASSNRFLDLKVKQILAKPLA